VCGESRTHGSVWELEAVKPPSTPTQSNLGVLCLKYLFKD